MSSSSFQVENLNPKKPLNPSALSYEPLFGEPRYHQLLFPLPLPGNFVPHSSLGFSPVLLSYYPEKQPNPRRKLLHIPKSIPYNGIGYGSPAKKERGKWGFIPPRLLKSTPRELLHPVRKGGGVWIRNSETEKYLKASSDELDGKTSVMIKNVPNHFRRVDLLRMLDDHCRSENRKARFAGSKFCKSSYDFLYLPMDFGFHLNLGFAFVNFTSPVAALRFFLAFSNKEWSCGDGRKKTCEIGIAKFQGKDALKKHFQNSFFPCHSDDYLPVVFSPPRDGFNCTTPTLIGRRTRAIKTSKDLKVMIMTKRKNNILV